MLSKRGRCGALRAARRRRLSAQPRVSPNPRREEPRGKQKRKEGTKSNEKDGEALAYAPPAVDRASVQRQAVVLQMLPRLLPTVFRRGVKRLIREALAGPRIGLLDGT